MNTAQSSAVRTLCNKLYIKRDQKSVTLKMQKKKMMMSMVMGGEKKRKRPMWRNWVCVWIKYR